MIFKCIQCERDITALRFHSAIAVMSGKYHIPAVRVTLVCPYCSQHFSADVPYRMETTAEGGLHITVSRKH
ncbi:TPA: hypothetical protein PBP50_003569 [Escherichia coli]|nr:hypothetical protein [Escherichia coli]